MKSIILSFSLLCAPFAFADFGEIDLLVRDSIAQHFREYGKSVDLGRLEYVGEPRMEQGIMTVKSSVWAEQEMIKPYWGWHSCVTRIEVRAPGRYSDRGSSCYFDFD